LLETSASVPDVKKGKSHTYTEFQETAVLETKTSFKYRAVNTLLLGYKNQSVNAV